MKRPTLKQEVARLTALTKQQSIDLVGLNKHREGLQLSLAQRSHQLDVERFLVTNLREEKAEMEPKLAQYHAENTRLGRDLASANARCSTLIDENLRLAGRATVLLELVRDTLKGEFK